MGHDPVVFSINSLSCRSYKIVKSSRLDEWPNWRFWHHQFGAVCGDVIGHLALPAIKGSLSSLKNHEFKSTNLRVPHGIIPLIISSFYLCSFHLIYDWAEMGEIKRHHQNTFVFKAWVFNQTSRRWCESQDTMSQILWPLNLGSTPLKQRNITSI